MKRAVPRFFFLWLLGAWALAAVFAAAVILWTHRVELFVIPRAWKEVLELRAQIEGEGGAKIQEDLDRAVHRLIAA